MLPRPAAIDAVLFDAGGVLLLPDAEAGRSALEPLGYAPSDEAWMQAHYSAIAAFDRMAVTDWHEVRRAFALTLGVAEHQLEDAVPLIEQLVTSGAWAAVEGAADLMRAIAARGYRVGVISNAFGTIADELEAAAVCSVTRDDLPRVAVIVDSHQVGIEKPDPRIFDLALDALGTAPDRAIYVGDSVRADVAGASAAGLYPLHLDPYATCHAEHAHLDGLPALLDWLSG